MQYLLSLDTSLLNLIAEQFKNSIFDFIMPAVSDSKLWIIPLIIFVVVIVIRFRKKGLEAVIICLIAVAISDFVCASIIKPLIARPRPVGISDFSFPSCHASNMSAAATVFSYYFRKLWVRITAYGAAVLVAYSRVYTLSHYPSDVIAGIAFGILFAGMVILAYKRIIPGLLNGKNI